MNPETGHLVADMRLLDTSTLPQYQPIPFHLRVHAEKTLDGRAETCVNVNAQNALSDWARKRKAKSRTRATIAKRSRKASR